MATYDKTHEFMHSLDDDLHGLMEKHDAHAGADPHDHKTLDDMYLEATNTAASLRNLNRGTRILNDEDGRAHECGYVGDRPCVRPFKGWARYLG